MRGSLTRAVVTWEQLQNSYPRMIEQGVMWSVILLGVGVLIALALLLCDLSDADERIIWDLDGVKRLLAGVSLACFVCALFGLPDYMRMRN